MHMSGGKAGDCVWTCALATWLGLAAAAVEPPEMSRAVWWEP
jgi:hypothetical protein